MKRGKGENRQRTVETQQIRERRKEKERWRKTEGDKQRKRDSEKGDGRGQTDGLRKIWWGNTGGAGKGAEMRGEGEGSNC